VIITIIKPQIHPQPSDVPSRGFFSKPVSIASPFEQDRARVCPVTHLKVIGVFLQLNLLQPYLKRPKRFTQRKHQLCASGAESSSGGAHTLEWAKPISARSCLVTISHINVIAVWSVRHVRAEPRPLF